MKILKVFVFVVSIISIISINQINNPVLAKGNSKVETFSTQTCKIKYGEKYWYKENTQQCCRQIEVCKKRDGWFGKCLKIRIERHCRPAPAK